MNTSTIEAVFHILGDDTPSNLFDSVIQNYDNTVERPESGFTDIERPESDLTDIERPESDLTDNDMNTTVYYEADKIEERYLELVNINPKFIANIEDPSEEVQKAAVSHNSSCIYDIKNPCLEVVKMATAKGRLIDYKFTPKNEMEEIFMCTYWPERIVELEYPCEDCQLVVIKRKITNVKLINRRVITFNVLCEVFRSIKYNRNENVDRYILENLIHRIHYFVQDDGNAKKLFRHMPAILKFVRIVHLIDKPSEEVLKMAITLAPSIIGELKTVTVNLKLHLIEHNIRYFKLLKNPEYEVIVAALKKDISLYKDDIITWEMITNSMKE